MGSPFLRGFVGSSTTGNAVTDVPLSINAIAAATTTQFPAACKTPNRAIQTKWESVGLPPRNPCWQAALTSLPTPIKVSVLAFYLKGYDNKLANNLITGFTFGFKLYYRGNVNYERSPQNLLSAYAHTEAVDCKLTKERELGWIKGPFKQPPFLNFSVSPLGVIPEKTPGEYRMIHHLSFPYGLSVNDSILRKFCTVKYATVDDTINIVKKLGGGCAMAKTDVRNAFRILQVHTSDYHLLGIQWKGKWCHDACLPMGLASSCKHFENFSSVIEWIARNKLHIPDIIHILDDFLIVAKTLSDCGNRLHRFLGLCVDIGIPMAQEKTEGPAHVLTFAGIELNCIHHVARLP